MRYEKAFTSGLYITKKSAVIPIALTAIRNTDISNNMTKKTKSYMHHSDF
jgi:hypothetical protein